MSRYDEGADDDLQVQRVEDPEVVARVEAERDAAVDPAGPEGVRQDKQQRNEEKEPEPDRDGREQARQPQGPAASFPLPR